MEQPKRWNVAAARRKFAAVLKAAEQEPQYVYRRGKVAAVVVSPNQLPAGIGREQPRRWATMKEALDELKKIAREEQYSMHAPKRTLWSREFARSKRGLPR